MVDVELYHLDSGGVLARALSLTAKKKKEELRQSFNVSCTKNDFSPYIGLQRQVF